MAAMLLPETQALPGHRPVTPDPPDLGEALGGKGPLAGAAVSPVTCDWPLGGLVCSRPHMPRATYTAGPEGGLGRGAGGR